MTMIQSIEAVFFLLLITHVGSFAPQAFSLCPTFALSTSLKPARRAVITWAKNEATHDVKSDFQGEMDPEELRVQEALASHQQAAPRLDFATSVRSLVAYQHGFAVLSTNSKSTPGFPSGSVVGFAPDDLGRPVFVFSGMSGHTQDVLVDPKCSLTVASQDFKGAADGRVNLMGTMEKIPRDEIDSLKELYLSKHPNAFWVNFGDFNWFRLNVENVRFVGGFARAGDVSASDYASSSPDPIVAVGGKVGQHMNEDHEEATLAMIKHYIGIEVEAAKIVAMDSLGMDIVVARTPRGGDQPQQFKIRLPFEEPVKERKDIKDQIVKMTQASATKATAE